MEQRKATAIDVWEGTEGLTLIEDPRGWKPGDVLLCTLKAGCAHGQQLGEDPPVCQVNLIPPGQGCDAILDRPHGIAFHFQGLVGVHAQCTIARETSPPQPTASQPGWQAG